jgi:hypothetical protein
VDTINGTKASRPNLDRLMADARLRRFDAVVVWKLDRWGRSLVNCLNSLEDLDRLGIRFIVPGQGIDTDKYSPVARLLMHVLSAVGQFERELIREHVVAGVRQAQVKGTKSGKPIGRPKGVFRRDQAVAMRAGQELGPDRHCPGSAGWNGPRGLAETHPRNRGHLRLKVGALAPSLAPADKHQLSARRKLIAWLNLDQPVSKNQTICDAVSLSSLQ